MKNKHYEQIGWLGFVLIVSAYLLLTTGLVTSGSAAYHSLNLLGALCMVANAKHSGAKPVLWLNIVWALVAVLGLGKQADILRPRFLANTQVTDKVYYRQE